MINELKKTINRLDKGEKLKAAEKVILEKFRNKVIGKKPHNAFVTREGAKEYRYSANKKSLLNEEIADAKSRVSTELDKVIETATFLYHTGKDDGRHKNTNGWDTYLARFKVGGEMYQGEIKIALTENGRVFKDITKIKNISQGDSNTAVTIISNSDSTGDVPRNAASVTADQKLDGKLADQTSGLSVDSIAKAYEKVKFQLKEMDSDGNKLSGSQKE